MLLNQFHESESGNVLEFNSRDVIYALNSATTSALHQLCQVMERYGAECLFKSLRGNNRFTCDYGSMNVENLISTLRMYYVLDTDEDFSAYAAESDRINDQISDYANDSFFGSKTEARINEIEGSLSESVICDFQYRHTIMTDNKIRNYYPDLHMYLAVLGEMNYRDAVNTLFTCDSFIYDVEHGAKFSVTKCQHNLDDEHTVPGYVIELTATCDQLDHSKDAALYNFIDVAKFCICKFGDVHANDVSGMQLELLAREAVHVTC